MGISPAGRQPGSAIRWHPIRLSQIFQIGMPFSLGDCHAAAGGLLRSPDWGHWICFGTTIRLRTLRFDKTSMKRRVQPFSQTGAGPAEAGSFSLPALLWLPLVWCWSRGACCGACSGLRHQLNKRRGSG